MIAKINVRENAIGKAENFSRKTNGGRRIYPPVITLIE
jgi:hypothetical protein